MSFYDKSAEILYCGIYTKPILYRTYYNSKIKNSDNSSKKVVNLTIRMIHSKSIAKGHILVKIQEGKNQKWQPQLTKLYR